MKNHQMNIGGGMRHTDIPWIAHLRRTAGFTLIELMIVVAIIAIATAIAVPSYFHYVVKTKRATATSCLGQYATWMERYYTSNLNYKVAALPMLGCAGADQTGDSYQYSLAAATSTAYTLQATPVQAQLQRDTKCGSLTLTQAGVRGASGPGGVAECW